MLVEIGGGGTHNNVIFSDENTIGVHFRFQFNRFFKNKIFVFFKSNESKR